MVSALYRYSYIGLSAPVTAEADRDKWLAATASTLNDLVRTTNSLDGPDSATDVDLTELRYQALDLSDEASPDEIDFTTVGSEVKQLYAGRVKRSIKITFRYDDDTIPDNILVSDAGPRILRLERNGKVLTAVMNVFDRNFQSENTGKQTIEVTFVNVSKYGPTWEDAP